MEIIAIEFQEAGIWHCVDVGGTSHFQGTLDECVKFVKEHQEF